MAYGGYFNEPVGGNTFWFGSLEYSVPIIDKEGSGGVRFAVFYDVGSVGANAYDFNVSGYSSDWGVGLSHPPHRSAAARLRVPDLLRSIGTGSAVPIWRRLESALLNMNLSDDISSAGLQRCDRRFKLVLAVAMLAVSPLIRAGEPCRFPRRCFPCWANCRFDSSQPKRSPEFPDALSPAWPTT